MSSSEGVNSLDLNDGEKASDAMEVTTSTPQEAKAGDSPDAAAAAAAAAAEAAAAVSEEAAAEADALKTKANDLFKAQRYHQGTGIRRFAKKNIIFKIFL